MLLAIRKKLPKLFFVHIFAHHKVQNYDNYNCF